MGGINTKATNSTFSQTVPNKRIAVTTLRRLYLKNGIKRKKVRQEKYKPEHILRTFNNKRRECIGTLLKAEAENRKLIFLDEICFTKRSF